jgi:hypothetical protein
MKKALQPVLVSAELWGRHFYAGDKLPLRVCVVNDADDGKDLPATTLVWQLLDEKGGVIASGKEAMPPVKYYGRQWIEPLITISRDLSQKKVNGQLVLKLYSKEHLLSSNAYDLLLATKSWNNLPALIDKKLVVVDPAKKILPVLDFLDIRHAALASVKEAFHQKADVYILALPDSVAIPAADIALIKSVVERGGKVLILGKGNYASTIYPEYIRGVIEANTEIVMMDIPESSVFDGIAPLETRYFNNNQPEIPTVCSGAFQVTPGAGMEALASSVKVHGYLQGDIYSRRDHLDKMKGYPIVKIKKNKGVIILSTMSLEKGTTDPVAGKLLSNMLVALLK